MLSENSFTAAKYLAAWLPWGSQTHHLWNNDYLLFSLFFLIYLFIIFPFSPAASNATAFQPLSQRAATPGKINKNSPHRGPQ